MIHAAGLASPTGRTPLDHRLTHIKIMAQFSPDLHLHDVKPHICMRECKLESIQLTMVRTILINDITDSAI